MRKTPAILAAALTLALHSNLYAKGTGYLFVSSEKDNAISVLDGSSYELVKQIGTAARPRHLQFSPDHSLIYAACGDGDAIPQCDRSRHRCGIAMDLHPLPRRADRAGAIAG